VLVCLVFELSRAPTEIRLPFPSLSTLSASSELAGAFLPLWNHLLRYQSCRPQMLQAIDFSTTETPAPAI
jgi:hypothetical protein